MIQIYKNPSLAHHKILDNVCSPLKILGIHFFGYTAIDTNGNAFCLGSKPEYAAEYLRRNHARNDVHSRSNKITKKYHYDFWDYLSMDRQTEELYRMAAAFDQGHTLTISQHDEKMTHCFHFSGGMTDVGINQRYLDKMDSLHAFITYFKNCLTTIPELATVYDFPIHVDLDKAKQKKKIIVISSDPRELELVTAANSTLYFKHQFRYYLSDNERECLKWLQLGKSAAIIAQIKNVSCKTIERYIESCKEKYKCYTMFQLGEKITTSDLSSFLALD